MRTRKKKLVIMLSDPRLFYRILCIFREKNIPYTIPKETLYICKTDEIAIVDEKSKAHVTGECKKITITNIDEQTIHKIMLYTEEKTAYKQLIIGIDPGKQYAYIVLGDGEIIEKGKTSKNEITKIVRKTMSIPHQTMRVKIGQTKSNIEKAMELATELARNTKAVIELVDEARTSKGAPLISNEKDTDIVAAHRIALKTGHISIKKSDENADRDKE